jgi:CBS domain-containing protein
MLLKEIMNREVVLIKSDATMKDAAKTMFHSHIGSLVVIKGESIVGILTGGDILKAISHEKNLDTTVVEEMMSKDVISMNPDNTLDDAVKVMMSKRIKHIPIVDGKKIVGIVTASDVITIEPKLVSSIANLISVKFPGYRGG